MPVLVYAQLWRPGVGHWSSRLPSSHSFGVCQRNNSVVQVSYYSCETSCHQSRDPTFAVECFRRRHCEVLCRLNQLLKDSLKRCLTVKSKRTEPWQDVPWGLISWTSFKTRRRKRRFLVVFSTPVLVIGAENSSQILTWFFSEWNYQIAHFPEGMCSNLKSSCLCGALVSSLR